MNTCLYVGSVVHRRHAGAEHAFRKSLYMAYLDLAELEEAFAGCWLWGAERRRWMSFRRGDHLVAAPGGADRPLAEAARDEVERALGRRPAGPVRLLTNLRAGGLAFSPVSFFYCFDEGGDRLDAVVAEVNNTPWGEQHCYVLDRPEHAHREHPKAFHVSPFQPMAQSYHWRITCPGERLVVGIESREAGRRAFDAVLTLERRPWTAAARARVLTRFPAMSAEILAGIYWQAARLLLQKRARFHGHPSVVPHAMETSP